MVKGRSCLSLSFMLGCPRRKKFHVTTDTFSPMAKCGGVDGSVRACISSLCSCITERAKVCTSCNNRNRSYASCETGIDGRMLNSRSGGSSRENPKLASKGICSIPSAREALYANSASAKSSNQNRRNNISNEEAVGKCCSRSPLVRQSPGVDCKTCSDAFRGVAKVSAESH
jgi:hypothetical protein